MIEHSSFVIGTSGTFRIDMASEMLGRFIGELVLKVLDDGRRMQLVHNYAFEDPDSVTWPVPEGAIVDGASIPRPLWSLIGGPWEGKYRKASVIHDYYCSVRSEECLAVHRVFYRGMLASGVARWKAKVMYAAVYFAGPRWTDMDVMNARVGLPKVPVKLPDSDVQLFVYTDPLTNAFVAALFRNGNAAGDYWRSEPDSVLALSLDHLVDELRATDPSLEQIENALDAAVAIVRGTDAPRSVFSSELAPGYLAEPE